MRSNPLTILIAFALAAYATVDVMTGNLGPLAIAAKWLGMVLVLVSFVRPKLGLPLLMVLVFYGDFYKKLAVIYGTVNMETVVEVLAVTMAMLGAVIVGTVVKIAFDHKKTDRSLIVVGLITFLITAVQAISGTGLTDRVQAAVNGGLYLGLAAVVGYFYSSRRWESLSLTHLQCLLAVPWVLVAIWQYFFGFLEMDWAYAKTGFSPVLSASMLGPSEPRVFGLAGNSPAYGAITILCAYCLWRALTFQPQRLLFIAGTVFFYIGLLVSEQRTTLLIPVMAVVLARIFRVPSSTKTFYKLAIGGAVVLIVMSPLLIQLMLYLDSEVQSTFENGWAKRVLRVSTFSDRLIGWERLTRGSTWTILGKGTTIEAEHADHEDHAHDMINAVLLKTGVLGLLPFLAILFFSARTAHRFVWRCNDPRDRQFLSFILGIVVVCGGLAMLTGNNLHTNPWNLILATLIGHAVAVSVRVRKEEQQQLGEQVPNPAFQPTIPPTVYGGAPLRHN